MAIPPLEIVVTAATKKAEEGLKRVGAEAAKTKRKTDTTAAGSNRLAGSLDNVGASAFLASNRSRMLTQQLSQVAQQATATGQVGQALAIQAADIGLAFGTVGTIVGALAGIALPTLISVMSDAEAEGEKFEDVLEEIEASLKRYSDAAARADLTTGLLSDQFLRITPGITAANRALAAAYGRETQDNVQALIEKIALMGREAGDGANALRGELNAMAAIFDMDIGLAFSKESIAARDAAREMLASFVDLQISLENSEGSLDEQVRIMRQMILEAEALAVADGKVTAEENEFIVKLSQALLLLESQLDVMNRQKLAAESLNTAITSAQTALSSSVAVAENLAAPIWDAATAAGKFAMNLFEANKQQAAIIAQAQQREGGGRGGDPRQFGLDAAALALLRMGGEFITNPPSSGGRAGGGARGSNGLDSLIESLQTEREVLDQWREESLGLLMTANERELEALGGFNEARLRLEEEYQARLKDIKQTGADSDLAIALGSGAEVLSALGAFNDKALRIAKVAAAAQALINAWEAHNQVLADPTLPWFSKIAAAASVLSSGLGAVSAIRSVSSSGGGGGAAGGATGGGAAPARDTLSVSISGVNPGDIYAGSQINSLTDAILDNLGDRNLDIRYV